MKLKHKTLCCYCTEEEVTVYVDLEEEWLLDEDVSDYDDELEEEIIDVDNFISSIRNQEYFCDKCR